ncbi:hypothetical protein NGC65_00235 [Staphylococcus xylosus]|uniref:hypothetical protein n=1 Tax=Staphylococcus xylosus TaxID=1288 RepID=UPI002DB9432B|nr:hypothetical protein [Staphylococcus xylosus]MEB7863869.1 hypothetical protein [Staphylococcus xylosus]
MLKIFFDKIANFTLLLIRFFSVIIGLIGLIVTLLTFDYIFPWILKTSKGSSLGLIIEGFQNYSEMCIVISFLITYFVFCGWLMISAFLNFNISSKHLFLSFVCTLGIFPILFLFTLILASTKPSDLTLIISVLSAIGGCITFCYGVFKNNSNSD